MSEKVFIFGHKSPDTDTICSSLVKAKLDKLEGKENHVARRLGDVNNETKYVLDYLKIDAPELLEKVEDGQEVILVDHNEALQCVDNIENAKVLEVIDHHKINMNTAEPLYYTAKPYGCTSTILFEEFEQKGLEIDKETAMLMLSAIVSDTLLLKSPTCTEHDVEAFKKLSEMVDVDAESYGLDMLKAGTDISMYSAEEIINLDAKEFEESGKRFVIAQVNTADIDDVFKRKDEITAAMQDMANAKKLDVIIFTITDIINTNSKIIALGEHTEIVEKAFDKTLDSDNAMFLEGVVSRKKQIAPAIIKVL